MPYFIILIICGVPMLFLELAVGQYTGRGPIGALGQICPLFKGKSFILYKIVHKSLFSVIIDKTDKEMFKLIYPHYVNSEEKAIIGTTRNHICNLQ